jgi:hypothetical protein
MKRGKIDKSKLALSVPMRIRSEAHRRFVASLLCCGCGAQPPTQAAHLRSGGAGGTGLKPCDSLTLPLCAACHSRQHHTSEAEFFGNIDRVKALAKALYTISGDGLKGLQLIAAHRQGR